MVASIAIEFCKYSTAKEVWDHLAKCYVALDLAKHYKLNQDLFHLRQAPGQTIADIYAQMNATWQQLDEINPKLENENDMEKFDQYREKEKLFQLLIVLLSEMNK